MAKGALQEGLDSVLEVKNLQTNINQGPFFGPRPAQMNTHDDTNIIINHISSEKI